MIYFHCSLNTVIIVREDVVKLVVYAKLRYYIKKSEVVDLIEWGSKVLQAKWVKSCVYCVLQNYVTLVISDSI